MKPLKMRADAFILDVLNARRSKSRTPIQLSYKVSPYKIKGNHPTAEGMEQLNGNRWEGKAHDHIWLRAEFEVPKLSRYKQARFCLETVEADLYNPQILGVCRW